VAARNDDLGELDHSRKEHERDHDQTGFAAVADAKGLVAMKIATCSKLCGVPVSGRHLGGTRDSTVITTTKNQAATRAAFSTKSLIPDASAANRDDCLGHANHRYFDRLYTGQVCERFTKHCP